MNKKDFQNGFIAGAVSGGVVEVIDTTEIDNLEEIIDNSGVLEDTEGSVTEKVEQLISAFDDISYMLIGGNNNPGTPGITPPIEEEPLPLPV